MEDSTLTDQPKRTLKAFVDLDDLWHPQQITDLLLPIKAVRPDFKATVYAVPNRLGPIRELAAAHPWLTFGIHGWEHTHGECLSWTVDEAKRLIAKALEMGYHPAFKAPNWLHDAELVEACGELGVILHHHETWKGWLPGRRYYPGLPYWRTGRLRFAKLHTHLTRNPATDWIGNHPGFQQFNYIDGFLTIDEVAVTAPAPSEPAVVGEAA